MTREPDRLPRTRRAEDRIPLNILFGLPDDRKAAIIVQGDGTPHKLRLDRQCRHRAAFVIGALRSVRDLSRARPNQVARSRAGSSAQSHRRGGSLLGNARTGAADRRKRQPPVLQPSGGGHQDHARRSGAPARRDSRTDGAANDPRHRDRAIGGRKTSSPLPVSPIRCL